MRHFLRSILAVALIALAAACQNEPPHEPVKPKPFAFENKHINGSRFITAARSMW